MLRTFFSAAAGVGLLAGFGLVPAAASDIETAQALWEKAFATGDGAKAAEMAFTEDARLLPDGAPLVEGRKAVAAFWQAGFDAGYRDLDLGLTAVDMVGNDTMIETGTWAVTVPDGKGNRMKVGGKALVVWKKQADGVWRMAQDMWNTDGAPAN